MTAFIMKKRTCPQKRRHMATLKYCLTLGGTCENPCCILYRKSDTTVWGEMDVACCEFVFIFIIQPWPGLTLDEIDLIINLLFRFLKYTKPQLFLSLCLFTVESHDPLPFPCALAATCSTHQCLSHF